MAIITFLAYDSNILTGAFDLHVLVGAYDWIGKFSPKRNSKDLLKYECNTTGCYAYNPQ